MNKSQFEVYSNLGIVEGEYIRRSNHFAGLKCEIKQRKQYDEYYINFGGFSETQEVSLEQILELAKTFKVVICGDVLTVEWNN